MNETFLAMQGKALAEGTAQMYERRAKQFKAWINEADLSEVTTTMLCNYIDRESKRPDGSLKTFSTPESVYSALVALYRSEKRQLPDDFRAEWAKYSKGFKKTTAVARQEGHLPTKGSDKLTIDQYRLLSKLAAKSNKYYVHGFLVMAWNCMTRIGDTSDIRYEHLSFETDHIVVIIPRNKADPTGELTATGKSVYPNPFFPEICAFLTIGIVVMSRGSFKRLERIFMGTKSEENINVWLKETEQMSSNYMNKAHLTSHCTRKGAASYVSSLSGLANVLAVISRGGWRLPGVLPVYITQENGGDQMVSD